MDHDLIYKGCHTVLKACFANLRVHHPLEMVGRLFSA